MRKLGVLLVVSILLFVFGCGTFVYELSQISPNQIDLSKETQTMTTTMPDRCRLYTKTYLSSVGDVRVVVDEMVEDNQLPNNSLVITYPKMLHVVHRVWSGGNVPGRCLCGTSRTCMGLPFLLHSQQPAPAAKRS